MKANQIVFDFLRMLEKIFELLDTTLFKYGQICQIWCEYMVGRDNLLPPTIR